MTKSPLQWMVIGAGPAGIAAVGKLIDQGVAPEKIGWMDPHFEVGDLGRKWGKVSSNTHVDLFHQFLNNCKAFEYSQHRTPFPLDTMDPQQTCLLQHIAGPLQWVTERLKNKVQINLDTALALNLFNKAWEIKTETKKFYALNVVLATGSEAKYLNYPGTEVIPIETALDPDKLAATLEPHDTVGVFGSSHSAVLILATLVQHKTKVINFYRSPHHYAIDLDGWILFDNTGLKGYAADWAKKHLDGHYPPHFTRVLTTEKTFQESLALCNKVIYAVGFNRRKIPVLEQYETMDYNDKTGIIAPGLFGIGIAFPQAQYDPLMNLEHRVGLWKFMDYLNTIMPIWHKYSN